jgi:hypothetical protein
MVLNAKKRNEESKQWNSPFFPQSLTNLC